MVLFLAKKAKKTSFASDCCLAACFFPIRLGKEVAKQGGLDLLPQLHSYKTVIRGLPYLPQANAWDPLQK
jgi:hypothetical protein